MTKIVSSRLRILLAEKSTRERRKISQRLAAQEAGISKTTFDRIIRNDFDGIRNTTLVALCEYFNCDIEDLIVVEDGDEFHPEAEAPTLEMA
jgi:putative transcriptional regulator